MKGILWKTLASITFALISVLVRALSKGQGTLSALPSAQIVFLENILALGIMIFMALRSQEFLPDPRVPTTLKTRWKKFWPQDPLKHLLRVLFACWGTLLWYLSLQHMQVGYASALAFTGPIFTVLGGFVLLKERLNFLKTAALFLSFAGAFLIMRPDLALKGQGQEGGLMLEVGSYALLPILSALCIAGAKLVTRQLAKDGTSSQRLTLYLMVGLFPASLGPALLNWVPVTPMHLLWCALLGGLVVTAQYATAQAFRYAGINFLTPFSFLRLVLGIMLGYILFHEIPHSFYTWVGIGTLMISVVMISVRSSGGFSASV